MALSISEEEYLRKTNNDFGVSEGSEGYHYFQDNYTANGVLTVFNLTHLPTVSYIPFVYLNGVIQDLGYTLAGTVLTFLVAPANLTAILVVYSY